MIDISMQRIFRHVVKLTDQLLEKPVLHDDKVKEALRSECNPCHRFCR
jgi:hypothetical protein